AEGGGAAETDVAGGGQLAGAVAGTQRAALDIDGGDRAATAQGGVRADGDGTVAEVAVDQQGPAVVVDRAAVGGAAVAGQGEGAGAGLGERAGTSERAAEGGRGTVASREVAGAQHQVSRPGQRGTGLGVVVQLKCARAANRQDGAGGQGVVEALLEGAAVDGGRSRVGVRGIDDHRASARLGQASAGAAADDGVSDEVVVGAGVVGNVEGTSGRAQREVAGGVGGLTAGAVCGDIAAERECAGRASATGGGE